MPIYEYRRPDGTTFDVIQKFSDDSLTVDPETGVPVVKVLSAPAIHFKGSGFHNTDYGTSNRNREKAAQDAAKSSSSDAGSSSSSSEGSSSSSSDSSAKSDSSAAPAPAKSDSGSKPAGPAPAASSKSSSSAG